MPATIAREKNETRRGLATMRQACIFLDVSRPSIYKLIERGELTRVKLPGTECLRFKWSQLEALADPTE